MVFEGSLEDNTSTVCALEVSVIYLGCALDMQLVIVIALEAPTCCTTMLGDS